MPRGGTLKIDTTLYVDADYAAVRVGLKTGRDVRLRVSDNGMGMPPDVLARVFEPFFTTTSRGDGTGLGLATVYGIITQVDGHVHIYSEPGVGTTFAALLPATDEAADETVDAATAGAQPPGGGTILVVEDEDAIRAVTGRILTRNGYTVIAVATGAEAIDVARREQQEIHLLLTDVIMPQMLGKEVAARIRATRPGLRTLFMSGYAHPVLTSQGTLEPGVALIEKPFTGNALLDRVKEILDAG